VAGPRRPSRSLPLGVAGNPAFLRHVMAAGGVPSARSLIPLSIPASM